MTQMSKYFYDRKLKRERNVSDKHKYIKYPQKGVYRANKTLHLRLQAIFYQF